MKKLLLMVAAFVVWSMSVPAHADEIFGGVLAHDVETGVTVSGIEGGVEEGLDVQLGWRGDRIGGLGFLGRPSPYAFLSVSTAGDTSFGTVGLSWKFGNRLYVRPGIGVAVHDGPSDSRLGNDRIVFGSKILFAPELSVGYQVNERVSIEATWVHLSHAKLGGEQNPGMDSIGARLNYRF